MDQAQCTMQTESSEVLYDVADHIAVITLNAPERMNTISGPMLNDLTRLLVGANEDRDVRCVILTGNGRAFCAGLDLRKERSGDSISSASSATSLLLPLFKTQDMQEGIKAFIEKREPKFEGR